MIAKCIAILAIVAQINASGCGQSAVVLQSSGSSCGSSPVALVSSGSSSSESSTATVTRNLVGRGKYPVALRNCGPTPDRQIPVTTTRVTAPVQEKTIRLPSSIPAPRTICHTCTCYKTILRPRVNQQIITVPTVQRYIETTHKPVVENIQYEAVPVNCNDDGSSSGSLQFVEVGSSSSGSSCGSSQVQVQVPTQQFEAVEVPTQQFQVVEQPRIQVVEQPRVQVVEQPRVVEAVQVPRVQVVEVPRVQTVQAVQVPRVQVVEAQRVQAVQIPQISVGSSCSSC